MNEISKKQFLTVFLCYCRQDAKAVHTLYARLKKDGIPVWFDAEDLLPGQNWQQEIRHTILTSGVIVVCLSQNFNKRQGYRHEEVKLALEKAKLLDDQIFIIPARLEKCDMPESLSHLHRVDLFEATGYKKLLKALQRMKKNDL